jgi:hypothetical protein
VIEVKPAPGDRVIVLPEPPPPSGGGGGDVVPEGWRPTVEIALLLDTSNSMDGLIDQAKRQLWGIVRQFAKAKKHGQTPTLRVALFEYGNTNLPASEGYLRQVVPLTDDLDKVSAGLFALSTNGGDEYCGQVIEQAVERLDWSKDGNGYKAIFIAGNEPFTQGSVDYRLAASKAIGRGIVVNTIHCGGHGEGIEGMWADGASLGEGKSFNIDQDRAVVHIEAPQDRIIIQLNSRLNDTYLWYGQREERVFYRQNQVAQDVAAESIAPAAAAERAATKASVAYSNLGRDLVDSFAAEPSKLGDLDTSLLPEPMQKMNEQERREWVEQKAAERAELQAKIAKLQQEREAWLAENVKPERGEVSLGDAMQQVVVEQLKASGFQME